MSEYRGTIFPVTVEHLEEIDVRDERRIAWQHLGAVTHMLDHFELDRAEIQTLITALSPIVEKHDG